MTTSTQTDHTTNLPTDPEYTAHWMNRDWIVTSSTKGPHTQDILRFKKTAQGRTIEVWRLPPSGKHTRDAHIQPTLALFDVWATGCTWKNNSHQPILQGTTRDGSLSFEISRDVNSGTRGRLTCTPIRQGAAPGSETWHTLDVWVASEGGSGIPGEPGTPPKGPSPR
jgi:hypothetical protein